MKRNRVLLGCLGISVAILIAVLIAAGIKNSKKNSEKEGKGKAETKTEELGVEEEENMDIFSIPGYINGVDKDSEQIICGILLPYRIQDTPIVVEGIGQYSGPFVEDGSDKPVANALAAVIKNDSDTVIEFAEIRFAVNDSEEAVFQISTIPAEKEVVVLEKNGREYHEEDMLNFTDKLYAEQDFLSLMEDEVEITSEDGKLIVKNLTQEPLGTVYVRYKGTINSQYYLGGITYSCKVENVDASACVEARTKHFNENGSQILMVEAIQE